MTDKNLSINPLSSILLTLLGVVIVSFIGYYVNDQNNEMTEVKESNAQLFAKLDKLTESIQQFTVQVSKNYSNEQHDERYQEFKTHEKKTNNSLIEISYQLRD